MTLGTLAIIAIVYILLMVLVCLFMRGCKSEEEPPMGYEAGTIPDNARKGLDNYAHKAENEHIETQGKDYEISKK